MINELNSKLVEFGWVNIMIQDFGTNRNYIFSLILGPNAILFLFLNLDL